MRYRAFISYSHRDEAVAQRLHRRLERYRPPKGLALENGSSPERLYPIFRDKDETAASHSLPASIRSALESSQHLIVLCSPASVASEWVNAEIRLFADIASAEKIFPVIVDGDALTCFPPALHEFLDDPLAPDLQEGMDGFDDGTLKLIAGLWGTPFNTLKNRDAAWRRQRSQVNMAIAAALGGLAVFAVFSGWRAQEQKRLAETEAEIAEARSLASLARFTLDRNPGETSVAAMVAVQSLALSETPEAKRVLRESLMFAPLGANDIPFPWRSPTIAVSGDGKVTGLISVYASDEEPAHSEIVSLDLDLTERSRLPFEGLAIPTFSSDGVWMAIAGRTRRLVIQRVDTGEIALDQPINSGATAAFSETGSDFYAATQLGEILHWQAGEESMELLTTVPVTGSRLSLPHLTVSDDNEWLLFVERGKPTVVISTRNGAVQTLPFVRTYETTGFTEQEPTGALTQPGDTHVLTYDSFNTGALWDVDSMQTLWTFNDQRHNASRKEANAISADGALFARGYLNDGISLRDMTDGTGIREFTHGGDVLAVRFIDGARKLVAGGDGGVSIWTVASDHAPIRCAVDVNVTAMEVEAEQETLLLGTDDGRLIRCDPATGKILAERRFRGYIARIATEPSGLAISLKLSELSDNWTEIAFVSHDTGKTVLRSINEPFDQMQLSTDGTRAATRSWLKRDVAIWDTGRGEIVARIPATGDLVGFTTDGRHLLMSGDSLTVYDVQSGQRRVEMGEPAGVWSISAHLNNTVLITNGDTGSGREHWAWNTQTGKRLWRAPEAAAIASAGDLYVLDNTQAGQLVVMNRLLNDKIGWIPLSGELLDVALSADGSRLIASQRIQDSDGHARYEVELWNVPLRKKLWNRQLSNQAVPPKFASLTKAHAVFVQQTLGNEQGRATQLQIIDWATGESVFEREWPGFESPFWLVDSKRDELLLTFSKETMLLDINTGVERWRVSGQFDRGMAFTPDGAYVVAADSISSAKDEIVVLDRRDGVEIRNWVVDDQIQDVAVTSDSQHVLIALLGDDWNGIKAFRIDNQALVHELEMDAAPDKLIPLQAPHELIVRDYESAIRAFDLRDGRLLRHFPMSIRAGDGAFSADGQRAFTVTGARIRFWNTESGVALATLATKGDVTAFAVSHDGKKIAFVTPRKRVASNGASSDVVEIWQPDSGEETVSLPAVNPRSLVYDPTDSVIAIRSGEATLRVVDAHTLSPRFTLRTLANGTWPNTNAVTFSRDGRYLALVETASYSQGNLTDHRAALRVFETTTGDELARFDISAFRSVTAASGGGFIYVNSIGTVRLFDRDVATLDQVLATDRAAMVLPVPNTEQLLLSKTRNGDALVDIGSGKRIELTAPDEYKLTKDSAVDSSGRYVAILRRYWQGEQRLSKVHVFDTTTGDELASLHRAELDLEQIEFALSGDVLVVSQVAQHAIVTDKQQSGSLYTWHWRDDQFQPLIDDNLVIDFAVSSDGESLVSSEGAVESETGEVYGHLQTRHVSLADRSVGTALPRESDTRQILVSASGERFALFSYTSPINGVIYNTEGDKLIEITLQDAAFYGKPLGFLHDGDLLAIGERSGARIIDISTNTGRRLRVPGRAGYFALSDDHSLLAIGGKEFVSVWDLATYKRLADFQVIGLSALTFAGSDSRSLIAVTERGVQRLEWEPTALISIACKAYRNDNWEPGRMRVSATDVTGLCPENP